MSESDYVGAHVLAVPTFLSLHRVWSSSLHIRQHTPWNRILGHGLPSIGCLLQQLLRGDPSVGGQHNAEHGGTEAVLHISILFIFISDPPEDQAPSPLSQSGHIVPTSPTF